MFTNTKQSAMRARRVREVKGWVEEAFDLTDESPVMVSELTCTEPGCPPLETVIVIMSQEKRQFKLHKPLEEITEEDIKQLTTKKDQAHH